MNDQKLLQNFALKISYLHLFSPFLLLLQLFQLLYSLIKITFNKNDNINIVLEKNVGTV